MLSVAITITGQKEEIAKLQKLKDKLTDFGSAMKTIGDEVVRYYAGEAYTSQGGVFDTIWPELSPAYAKRKADKYPGRGILVASGDMQRSFEADPHTDSVAITNTADYAVYHQSTDPRSKMPYRPIMKVNDEVKDIVRQIMQDDISDKLGNL